MNVTDNIIREILEKIGQNGKVLIRRSEFAEKIGCVPSQINYVIASRFKPELGYIVESRRGGGGFIAITRVQGEKSQMLMHIINSVGQRLSGQDARVIISNLAFTGAVTSREALLISSATADTALRAASAETRDNVRAGVMKNMLVRLVAQE